MNQDRLFFPSRLLSGLCTTILLGGCSFAPHGGKSRGDHAFISYWPPPENSGRLRVAVKDLIDMKGYTTTAGSEYIGKNTSPATRDAACLAIARERGVDFVGKTNLTELAISTSGRNNYYGTPVNRWDGKHKYSPGGSSSGSAMAVADGRADVAIGTDTGGSIRLPAASCGVYGLKTTYGLVSLKGVFPISRKHLDTVGPMAADVPRLVQGMDLLERGFEAKYRAAVAAKPSAGQIRIGRLYIGGTDPAIDKALDEALAAQGFKVVRLDDNFLAKWTQADSDGKSIALGDAYHTDGQFLDKAGIESTTRTVILKGGVDSALGYDAAVARQKAWQRELARVFQRVDLIATPVLRTTPLRFPVFGSEVAFEYLVFSSQNTSAVNFSGNPAIAIPIDMPREGRKKFIPVTSLQLVGPRNGEAQLINAARLLALKKSPAASPKL